MGADFSLYQLELFVAVAEELHFHRAAERMHISQPPLTRHIRALEGSLGVQLFERSSRTVALTRAGEAFLTEARRVIAAAGRASATARRAAQGTDALIVGSVESACVDLLPCVLAQFCQEYPDVSVDVREMHTRQQEHELLSGQIDLGILRPPTTQTAISTSLLYSDTLVLAVAADSPLSGPIDLAALAHEKFIVHNRNLGIGVYSAVMQSCISAGFVPDSLQEASSTAMVLGLVAAGRGICLLPAPYTLTRPFGVKFLKLTTPSSGCGVAMAWRADDDTFALSALRGIVRKSARTLQSREPGRRLQSAAS